MIKKVLVTGAHGQLGKTINELYKENNIGLEFIFVSREELDITNKENLKSFLSKNKFNYCINCAAYTAVDSAENDEETAKNINTLGSKNLAIACSKNNVTLIHISTDFVFDGNKSVAYNETDQTNPSGVYGITKLKGEQEITQHLKEHFIIRTSWLYSEHGNNFMNTMIRLSQDRELLSVVEDQIGTPTYAKDLASVIFKIITTNSKAYGLYHYSNEGVASWYDFAKAIFEETNATIRVLPITSEHYPTLAKRPHFSVLDKAKIKTNLQIEIPYWRDSLKQALSNL